MSKNLKTVTRRAVLKVQHQAKYGCKKPPCDKFVVTSDEMKSIWEWHNHLWLKYFRILILREDDHTVSASEHNYWPTLLLLIFWVTQNASGLTQISMVKVWSKCRVISPMPLVPWKWRHCGPWEPQKITDVAPYIRRKRSSTYFLIQGFTQSGTVTEWFSEPLSNIFVPISPPVKITLFYALYLEIL
jgi:hypothetical protein